MTHIYTAHIDPEAAKPYESAVFVKEGFCWGAFLFGPLWALYHRAWWVALGFFVASGLLDSMISAAGLHAPVSLVIQAGYMMVVGFFGNDALRWHYRRKGFITADIVAAEGELAAQQRFLERSLPAQSGV